MVEKDLHDLAKAFCSMKGYGSPTAMRYSLFIQKDGTVGDESFSYQTEDASVFGVHLRRLREQGMIGLCSVKVYAEGSRYYGIHLSITDERFYSVGTYPIRAQSLKDDSSYYSSQSYYLSKVLRVVKDESGHPDFRNVQVVHGAGL